MKRKIREKKKKKEEEKEGRGLKMRRKREIKCSSNERRSQLILKIIIKPAIKRVNYSHFERGGEREREIV